VNRCFLDQTNRAKSCSLLLLCRQPGLTGCCSHRFRGWLTGGNHFFILERIRLWIFYAPAVIRPAQLVGKKR